MKAFLLTWNSKKYSWENINEDIGLLKKHQSLEKNWTCSSKQPKAGDIFFIKATGKNNGIFCSGIINTLEEKIHSEYNKSGVSNMVHGNINVLLNPAKEKILDTELLKQLFPNQNWNPQQSGILINNKIVGELKTLWENFVKNKNIFENEYFEKEFWEGNIQRKLYTSYERNSRARNECIKHFGYVCQVCGINMENIYGEIGKEYIHVHHKNFISNFNEEHKIDPIKDLTTVCPNCHAMLHENINGKYFNVEELRNSIRKIQLHITRLSKNLYFSIFVEL